MFSSVSCWLYKCPFFKSLVATQALIEESCKLGILIPLSELGTEEQRWDPAQGCVTQCIPCHWPLAVECLRWARPCREHLVGFASWVGSVSQGPPVSSGQRG